ncbi:MAG: chromosome partitioning protein ParA [Halolamina sp.]
MILAVVSGKGGVGKTTLSYELAAATGAVAVDGDLGMADLPNGRGPDLHDVLAGRAAVAAAVRGGPVAVVTCGRSLAGARAADAAELADALRTVERRHGTVVVDCPAGMRADVGVPLAVADAALVVLAPDRFAVADAVRTRELARELDAGVVAVAVNRVVREAPATAICEALGAPAVSVPADPRLSRSVAAERPVVETHPDSDPAAAVLALSERVASVEGTRSDGAPERPT